MGQATAPRWFGLCLAAGGVLLALFFVLHPGGGDPAAPSVINGSAYAAEHTLGVAAMVAIIFGLFGVGAALGASRLAAVGFVLATVGSILLAGVIYTDAYACPVIAANEPTLLRSGGPFTSGTFVISEAVPGIVWGVGLVLLGVAGLRSHRLSRPAWIILIVGAVAITLPPQPTGFAPLVAIQAGAVVLALGLFWAGWELWRGATAALP